MKSSRPGALGGCVCDVWMMLRSYVTYVLCLPRTLCIFKPYTLILLDPPRCYRSCLTLARSLPWHNCICLLASHTALSPSTSLPFNPNFPSTQQDVQCRDLPTR